MTASAAVGSGVGDRVRARPAGLEVADLRVSARSGLQVLDGVNISVAPGSIAGVVGESGSGKTTLLRCLVGAVAPGLDATGTVELVDEQSSVPLLGADRRQLRAVRSQRVAYLAQDPGRSLTPTMRIGAAIAERLPPSVDSGARAAVVSELLEAVGLPGDEDFTRRYPFALSGGQAQRVALARALAASPDVLLLDEPTTGLDVITQAELLDELVRQHQHTPRTTVIVSHDLAVIARLADDVTVLRSGTVVESGPCRSTLRQPTHPYTRQLVEACPDPVHHIDAGAHRPHQRIRTTNSRSHGEPVLSLRGLTAVHRRTRAAPVIAARDLDLDLSGGRCVALVGASGSGKSTVARAIVGAHVRDTGTVALRGRTLPPALDDRAVADRWAIQLVPQDPTSSLNPRRRVGRAVDDVLRRVASANDEGGSDIGQRARTLFEQVGLTPELMMRRPAALSGGERQRVVIARALAASPAVLVCDEVTSALDVSVQAGVIRLLRSLVDDRGLAMLFITHDLGLVHDIADDVAVLHDGRICEAGPVERVVHAPEDPATRALLAASPSLSSELAVDR
ncbi:MAG: ABC transporter ATP-binding protein [Actinomycetota bacterium]